MLEKLKENETKIKILYYSTFLIYFLGIVNLSRFKYIIIDILVAVNVVILLYALKRPWARGHEEELKILFGMMFIMGILRVGTW
jgi:hypothetical protein